MTTSTSVSLEATGALGGENVATIPDPPARGRTLTITLRAPRLRVPGRAVLAGLVVTALVVGAAFLTLQERRAALRDHDRQAVVAVARTQLAHLLDVNQSDRQRQYDQLLAGSTGAFRQDLQTSASTFQQMFSGDGVSTDARIVETGVISQARGKASVLTVTNVTIASPDHADQLAQVRARMTLTAVDGHWLISDLQGLS